MFDCSLLTRRSFLGKTVVAGVGSAASAALGQSTPASISPRMASYIDLHRSPDFVTAYPGLENSQALTHSGLRWSGSGVEVQTLPQAAGLAIEVSAPRVSLTHVHMRW